MPWETWFDGLGMFWGMSSLFAFSFFVLVAPAVVLVACLSKMSFWRSFLLLEVLAFLGVLLFYLQSEEGPKFSICLLIAALTASLLSIPFSISFAIRHLVRNAGL